MTGTSDTGLAPLQDAILSRTPMTARRIRYLGADPEGFAAASRARNPRVDVVTGASSVDDLDVVAADDLATALDGSGDLSRLRPGGALVAGLPADDASAASAALAALAEHGLDLQRLQPADASRGYFDDLATDLVGAWRRGALAPQAFDRGLVAVARRRPTLPLMHLRLFSYAPTLMDIRTRLPAEALRSEPDLVVTHLRPPAGMPALAPAAPKVFVMQRPAPTDPAVWRASMTERLQAGWIVVLEYDDHPELVARVKSRPVTDADWLRFSYVHGVQTSTPELAELFGRYNPEVRLFPNALFRLGAFPETQPRRVFYGAVTRGPFAAEVARSLAPAVAEFPDVEFVVVGDRSVFDALPTANKRFHDYMPYDSYLDLMATCAISLSPIEGSEHQETKSDAKFLDAAGRGVLTIASPPIYARVIRHGETGLIADRVADWGPLLARALREPAWARGMAHNAWNYVRTSRMFADQLGARHAWYLDLWRRKAELDAALLARMGA